MTKWSGPGESAGGLRKGRAPAGPTGATELGRLPAHDPPTARGSRARRCRFARARQPRRPTAVRERSDRFEQAAALRLIARKAVVPPVAEAWLPDLDVVLRGAWRGRADEASERMRVLTGRAVDFDSGRSCVLSLDRQVWHPVSMWLVVSRVPARRAAWRAAWRPETVGLQPSMRYPCGFGPASDGDFEISPPTSQTTPSAAPSPAPASHPTHPSS